jgi:redox-sensitive bicupin YhaK (pirin superfamily)
VHAQPTAFTLRTIARVEDRLHLGPDSQVDDKATLFTPASPQLTDPFLALADDLFSAPGFEWHPHRGMETVTLVLDGVLEHGDNIGHAGTLTAGDVQWMTAGRGIIHRELAYRDERAHILQLWVNLPAELKMVETRYQDLLAGRRPVIERDGTRIDLISGRSARVIGPALNHWPITGAVITLEPGRTVDHVLPAHDRAFLAVLSGQVALAGRTVHAGQTAWSDPVGGAEPSAITLHSADGDQPAVVLAFSGQPIGQPVAMGGPFVMTSRAEIHQAFEDFRNGGFGPVPRQARLRHR